MTKDNKERLTWIKNRVKKKTKINPKVTTEVLGVIADLVWDWRKSKFDFGGLDIETVLKELGRDRVPKEKKTDLFY